MVNSYKNDSQYKYWRSIQRDAAPIYAAQQFASAKEEKYFYRLIMESTNKLVRIRKSYLDKLS